MTRNQANKIATAAVEAAITEIENRITLDISLLHGKVSAYVDGAFVKEFSIERLLAMSIGDCIPEEDTTAFEIEKKGAYACSKLLRNIRADLNRHYEKKEKLEAQKRL